MRTVPVELGSTYLEDDWSQRLMTFSNFLNDHICEEGGKNDNF